MKRLIFGFGLALASFGAHAQDTIPARPARQAVDLQSYGRTTTSGYHPVAEGSEPAGRIVHTVATGEKAPLPVGYTRHKTTAGNSYITGPKGGCFYLNASGKKVYVDHKYCQ